MTEADAPTLDDIRATRELLRPYIRTTPCLELKPRELVSDSSFDSTLAFKLELFQLTGSFKARGALAVMLGLAPEQRARGVTAVSAGNHAVAVSWAAGVLGLSAHVVMLKSANPARVNLARIYGAEIEFAADGASAFRRVREIESEEGRAFVHPFEGPRTVRGTATCGAEFTEQVPALDAVVVAAGGGGLLAGVAAAMKLAAPSIRVYGVEPAGADSLSRSFAAGKPVTLERISTIADSLAPPMATPYTFEVCRRFVDRMVLVDDEAMRRTMAVMFRDLKLAVEPAAAAALAAVLGPLRSELSGGRRVGVVICGANIDLETFYRYAQL
ncbi:MAG TPA: pyridoxal-phosphate dependent enzyme, partial [Steroidobacteraceae bacterium]|nr:pyridoxal-phosphate dependent enzyme [Steroidobacteraceae bacterium]